jgi:hypothetical protein
MWKRVLPISILGLVLAAPLPAQESPPQESAVSLAPIAVQEGAWGRVDLVRLPERSRVGSLGVVAADLTPLASSAGAAGYARSITQNRRAGSALLALGAVLSAGALASYAGSDGGIGMRTGELAAFGGGISALLLGGQRVMVSRRELQRAVNAYNREAYLAERLGGGL